MAAIATGIVQRARGHDRGAPATVAVRTPALVGRKQAQGDPSAARIPGLSALLSPGIQRAMRVSSPTDPAEREAEVTARRIVQMPQPVVARAEAVVQRQAQGQATAVPDLTGEIQGEMGGGAPLSADVRGFVEPRFRADFSAVRIHTDAKAASLARRLSARAFAFGRHIFFGGGQFRPESRDGMELLAHELTHTIQQRAVVQRSSADAVVQRSVTDGAPVVAHSEPVHVQRGIVNKVLDYFADKANIIPGYRMFTIILGVNPINMSRVERSAANILRAIIEFIPGGGLITEALDNHGVFEKVGGWIEQQIRTLGMTGAMIKEAISKFIDSLGWTDIFDLGDVWARAKRIFTEPIDKLISFGKGLITGIIKFIKDAILMPLAKLAEGTRGYDLLKAVLGKDPITDQPVPRNAETLIGGFMKLIGQEEVWENMKKANAIGRAWAWFQGAMKELMAFVAEIPTLAINAFKSLELFDIVLVPRAFIKVGRVFANFLVRFISWAGNTVWNLLEIIFDVVSPGAWGYVKKTGAALRGILKNPLPFIGNLVKAAKRGFSNFADHFLDHLKAGLLDWLTGSLPGVYIPKSFALTEVLKFVLSLLGLSWQNIRQKLVKVIGETAVKAMETGFQIVVTLVRDGPAAAWDQIKGELSKLKDTVIGGIIDFVVEAVVTKAVPKLIAMFIPGAGFISAIISIYDVVMVFVRKIAKIIQVVKAFIDSIVQIASGVIDAAAKKVESILAGLLSLAISFLAGFIGLGKVADKVMGVINKVRAMIDKALDALIAWVVKMGKAFLGKLKSAAGKFLEWWKLKKVVSGAGVTSTLTTEGSETATRLLVASSPGEPWSSYLKKVNAKTKEEKDALSKAKTLAATIEAARKPSVTQEDHAKAVEKAFNELAEHISVLNGAKGNPASVIEYGGTDGLGGGVEAKANPLTEKHPQGTTPRDSAQIWQDLANLGKGLGISVRQKYYVQGHLLNENLGGPGMRFNLTPITKAANNAHKSAVETEIKKLVNDDKEVVSYTVKALAGPPKGKNPRLKELRAKSKLNKAEQEEMASLQALQKLASGFKCTAYVLGKDSSGKWTKQVKPLGTASVTIQNVIDEGDKTYGYQ